jgi:hypothetical protein
MKKNVQASEIPIKTFLHCWQNKLECLTKHKAENTLAYSGTTDDKKASDIPIKTFLLLAKYVRVLNNKLC